jgi:hypothetical protein
MCPPQTLLRLWHWFVRLSNTWLDLIHNSVRSHPLKPYIHRIFRMLIKLSYCWALRNHSTVYYLNSQCIIIIFKALHTILNLLIISFMITLGMYNVDTVRYTMLSPESIRIIGYFVFLNSIF